MSAGRECIGAFPKSDGMPARWRGLNEWTGQPAATNAHAKTASAERAQAAAAAAAAIRQQGGSAPAVTAAAGDETIRAGIERALRDGDIKALRALLARPDCPRDDAALLAAIHDFLVAAAEGGDAEAMFMLGQLGKQSFFGAADAAGIAGWFERAGDAGVSQGYAEAARLYMDGKLIAPNPRKSAAMFEKGIAAGNADSHLLKGISLLSPGADASAALGLILRAAELGSGDAALLLSRLYKDGQYVTRDEQAALEWATLAAERGSLGGEVDLGKLLTRLGRTQDAIGEGVGHLLDADARQSGRSALELARLIVNAREMNPADAAAAKAYAEDAFARGMSQGAFAAAMLSLSPGLDSADAEIEAREWLQAGAKTGDWQSKYALSLERNEGMSLRDAMMKAAASDRLAYVQQWAKNTNKEAPAGFTAPVPTYMPAPSFPDGLLVLGASGTVTAEFIVGADGVPINVQILQASDAKLAEAAASAVVQWRFNPGTKNGAPQPMRMRVPVRFRSSN